MKALILKEYKQLSLEEVPMPVYGKEEVLIRVKACAICGSDVHGFDGSTGRRIPPIVMGHEASGIIEKVGDKLSDPNAIMAAAKASSTMTGGFNGDPAFSSTVLLFSVALLAFGGYVAYSLKKTLQKQTIENDDSPPNPATVRGSTELAKA